MTKLILAAVVITGSLFGGLAGAVHATAARDLGPAHVTSVSASGQDSGSTPDGFSWG